MAENENTQTQENGTQGAENKAPENAAGKTFTQEEVNALIAARVNRVESKYADYEAMKTKLAEYEKDGNLKPEEANKKIAELTTELDALKKADGIRVMREKISKETGIPAHLLTAETEEECTAQANSIKEFAQPGKYPTVPDGGETHGGKPSTSQQFADWFTEQIS
jgi:hypothetical protein